MIINISGRTDIVNHYSEWMFKRFEEGYVLLRNSLFPNSVRRYELTPDKIDCIIFGSKNFAPVLERIQEITDKFHTYFYYTITAYGKDIEPGVPDIDTSIETFLRLSDIVGAQRIAWRYDTILLTEKYTIQRHFETFAYIANRLAGKFDRCIFSFVEMYKKHEINGTFPDVKRAIEQLIYGKKNKPVKNKRRYYMNLGQITHYVADYFTFPHNNIYPGGLREHCAYEEELKHRLREYLKTGKAQIAARNKIEFDDTEELYKYILNEHEMYLEQKLNVEEDIHHIVSVNRHLVEGIAFLFQKTKEKHGFSNS